MPHEKKFLSAQEEKELMRILSREEKEDLTILNEKDRVLVTGKFLVLNAAQLEDLSMFLNGNKVKISRSGRKFRLNIF